MLFLRLARSREIRVGALGPCWFTPGWYAYAGSAFGPGGLAARLRHHLFSGAAPRWHIDYFKAHAEIMEIWCAMDQHQRECRWAARLARISGKPPPCPGFGSSDCRCHSHLFYFSRKPAVGILGLRVHVLEGKDFGIVQSLSRTASGI